MEEKHGDAIEPEFSAPGPGLGDGEREVRQKFCPIGASSRGERDDKPVCFQITLGLGSKQRGVRG